MLWAYRHLQELDRRQHWVGRLQRLEAAVLGAMSFHDPKLLDAERTKAIADAAGRVDATDALTQARDIAAVLPALLTDG